jgi:hypothetical protein
VQYLRAEVPGMPPVKRRMYPTKQIRGGRDAHQAREPRARCSCRTHATPSIDPDKDTRMRLYAAHYTIMENANDICRLAIRTCGGSQHAEVTCRWSACTATAAAAA